MALVDKFHQPAAVNVGVNLRGRDIDMAEHSLKRAQVRTPCQQMRCKSVAKDMRTDLGCIQAGLGGELPDDLEQPYPADMAAARWKQIA